MLEIILNDYVLGSLSEGDPFMSLYLSFDSSTQGVKAVIIDPI